MPMQSAAGAGAGSLHPPPGVPCAKVRAAADAWLQQLALLLKPGNPPPYIALDDLKTQLPMPRCVLSFYAGYKPVSVVEPVVDEWAV